MEFTQDQAQTLAAKLDALALTSGERAALDAVFEAASGAEAQGFALDRADRYFNVIWLEIDDRYIGETEKNWAVFEPNNQR